MSIEIYGRLRYPYYEYKGFHSQIEWDNIRKVYFGTIEEVQGLASFQGNYSEIESEFHKAVDDYIDYYGPEMLDEKYKYTGIFNVGIKSELHKRLVEISIMNNESLRRTVERAIEFYVNSITEKTDDKKNE